MNTSRLLIAAIATATAMTATARQWTLTECIDYATEHNITVRQSALQARQGELAITEAKDNFLPTVSGSASQSFDFGRGLTSENTYANRNTSNFGWSVNMQLPLFQGLQSVRQLDYARADLQRLLQQWEAAKDDVTLNVIAAYLQTLACQELNNVAQVQLGLSQVQLERQQELLAHGKVPELDVIQAQSQVAQDQTQVVSTANDWQLALLDLAQLLEVDDPEFSIAPLDECGMPLLAVDDVYNNALAHNHTILAGRAQIAAADRNISLAKTGYIPRLSMYAGLGSSYYKVSGFDNTGFAHQMRDNFSRSLGFSLSVPIFDAFSTRNSVRRARLAYTSAQLQLEQSELTLYKAIAQAYQQARGAEQSLQSANAAVEATHAAFVGMQDKYEYGKANATEYEQARAQYITALAQQVSARYQAALRIRILQFYNKQ